VSPCADVTLQRNQPRNVPQKAVFNFAPPLNWNPVLLRPLSLWTWKMLLHEGSARMDDTSPHRNKRLVILLAVFSCAFLLAIAAALTDHRRISWTEGTPPNGTAGSAQPGTIGLARPHPPLPVQ
jgi:hypothetical protein